MSDSPKPAAHAVCPKCGGDDLSFDFLYGTSKALDRHQAAVAEQSRTEARARQNLDRAYQARLAELQQEGSRAALNAKQAYGTACTKRKQAKAKLTAGNTGVSEEDQGFFLMQAEEDLRAEYQRQLAAIRSAGEAKAKQAHVAYAAGLRDLSQELENARAALNIELRGPAHRLAVVFCRCCGCSVGVAAAPADRNEEAGRISEGIRMLGEAIHHMHKDLVDSLAGVITRLQRAEADLAALNAREEGREQAAKVQAAASGIGRLLNS